MSFIAELKRRKVLHTAGVYGITAFGITEILTFVFENFGVPLWANRLVAAIFVAGFPIAMFLSWVFDIEPGGQLKRTRFKGQSTKPIVIAAVVMMVAATGGLFYLIFPQKEPVAAKAQQIVPNLVAAPDNSIAVLAFADMSPDKDQEYFSDGLSETLIHGLAQLSGLKVTAKTSSFYFKDKDIDFGEIARKLNVATILEGSVQKSGGQIRVIAQLINAKDGTHLWSKRFDRDLKDIFAIQDEIAQEVVKALEVTLLDAEKLRLAQRYQPSEDAYNLFLQGRFHVTKRGGELLKGISLLEQAILLDPKLAEAHAVLARAHALHPIYVAGSSPLAARDRTMLSARRALALEPGNGSALAAMGMAKAWYDFDFAGARIALEKAVESNPGNAEIHNFLGDFLAIIGDFETSLVHERKAAELDPLAAVHHSDMSLWLASMGRYEDAIAEAELALEIDPMYFGAYEGKALAFTFSGEFDAALETIAIGDGLFGKKRKLIRPLYQCYAYAEAGELEQARENLKILLAYHQDGRQISGIIATCYVLLRDFDNAGRWMEQAFVDKDRILTTPHIIRLPEQAPDSEPWQTFWKHPEMAALAVLRRSFGMPLGITATTPPSGQINVQD